MVKTDVVIIGAGLLGCFTARELSRYRVDVTVLEKEQDVCGGISKANTGIIYPGYDHKPGSLKSKLCLQAGRDFDELCRELGVPFSRPGSLMVAYGPRADEVIRRKYSDGISAGLSDIRIISGTEAESMEPSLRSGVTSALWSSSTGTVDPWELCIAAYENARDNGVRFLFDRAVTGISRSGSRFMVETSAETYDAAVVVNAAGLDSDRIREMTEDPEIRLFPTAADYIVLDRGTAGAVSHIIFHEGENGKGLTLVPTVDGSILAGPTEREADDEELASRDMRVSSEGLEELRHLCSEVVPGLDISNQIRTFGSLRPNPFRVKSEGGEWIREERSIKDIQIYEDDGLFSLIGIKTPGLTISNELGRLVAERITEYLGGAEPDPDFDPVRRPVIRARDLTDEERSDLVTSDPDYGVIVCSCMDVTLAEVRQAIERGAASYEAVRRRTGAGMGHCQGSRCRNRIRRILESE